MPRIGQDPTWFLSLAEHFSSKYGGSMADKYIVMCRREGGLSGFAESQLKANGALIYFGTEQEAKNRARHLDAVMNHAYAVATYTYWVEKSA